MLTTVQGIVGMVASVIAILGGLTIAVRYLGKKFDKWADAVIENSGAVRSLTDRVTRLEGAVDTLKGVMTKS